MSFSQDIKQSNTDEWYTTRESVELIVPYLLRGGATTRYYARSIQKKASM